MSRWVFVVVSVGAAAGACRTDTSPPAGVSPEPSAAASATASVGAATVSKSAAPAEALDAMDRRTAVPLLPMMAHHQKQNMRDHLVAVQEIVTALATDDFTKVESAAGRIGYSEQMGRMCSHMGAGAPGFTTQALKFHHTADRITAAARDRDHTAVLKELGATLQICTSCHATWKQQVVDEATWTRVTSTPAPSGPMGH